MIDFIFGLIGGVFIGLILAFGWFGRPRETKGELLKRILKRSKYGK